MASDQPHNLVVGAALPLPETRLGFFSVVCARPPGSTVSEQAI